MYEHRKERVLPLGPFLWRVARHAGLAGAVVFASLLAGMAGYAYFERLGWLDSFLNAAMLLGGMGPVDLPQTPGGKLFAGLYALYSGMVFLVTAGLVLSPIMHRALHRFHWLGGQTDDDPTVKAEGAARSGAQRSRPRR